ncbi:MAG: sulfurtransferase TusA family protein, partial [Paraperlucidibaca sp.]
TAMTDVITLDLRGLRCPMPLLKLKQALHRIGAGTRLTVLTSDSGAQRDIPAFLRHTSHQLVSLEASADGSAQFVIDTQSS